MQIGIIGLGRMGAGMARRLARGGVQVLCYDQAEAARRAVASEPGIECAEDLPALCARMDGERVIVLSLPRATRSRTRSQPRAADRHRRHAGRRRQQLLPRLHAPRARAVAAGTALHRRGVSAACTGWSRATA
jgi:pyrroline-5-carboxylate reductase